MTEEPRDRTLDSFVADWTAPLPGPEFHSRVQRAFEREFVKASRWRRWNAASGWRVGKRLLGSAAIGGLFFLLIGLAFSQTSRFALSWLETSRTMDLEKISYAEDGTPSAHTYWKIGPTGHGDWSNIYTYSPDRPYDDILPKVEYMLFRIEMPFVERIVQSGPRAKEIAAHVKAGCALARFDTAVGQETLAGYSTNIFQWNFLYPDSRVTVWRAPKLGCMELRRTLEERRPDGTYRLVSETRPLVADH